MRGRPTRRWDMRPLRPGGAGTNISSSVPHLTLRVGQSGLPRGSARDACATLGASQGFCSGEGGLVALTQETAMNRVHFAKWVPLVALALAVPVWAQAPPDEAKQNPTAAASDQANAGSDTKKQDQSGAAKAKGKGHGPTAVMDRATPAQKPSTSESSDKHPPTA